MTGLTNFVTVASSLVALLVSLANAMFYFADRQEKAHQAAFENQTTMTRIFYERIAGHYCENKPDAMLLVAITSLMAKTPQPSLPAPLGGPDTSSAISGLADLIGDDLKRRPCPGDAAVMTSGPTAAGAAGIATATRLASTTYDIKEQIAQAQQATPVPAGFVVYIQYHQAEDRARKLQQDLQKAPNLKAPGIERVGAVPNRDQIRIYKDSDADKTAAETLRGKFGLDQAQVISLAAAYPRLPARTLEVWLADP